jgi:hypothetical protein
MRHTVQQSFGMAGYDWACASELCAAAAAPSGFHGGRWPHDRGTVQVIGGGNRTVTAFALFITAVVPGPNDEPVVGC